MNAKHTPGPFEVARYKEHIGYAIYAKDRGCIAERWYDDKQEEPYGAEIEANARLFAAAPDLLEALKLALGWLDRKDSSGLVGAVRPSDVSRWRSAIAKAEGL